MLASGQALGNPITDSGRATMIEPSEQAVQNWQDAMVSMAMATTEFFEACIPGYYNNEGHVSENGGLLASAHGGGSEAFFAIIRDWREAGELEGVELS